MFPRKLKFDAFLIELDEELKGLGSHAFDLHPTSDHQPAGADKLSQLSETTQLYSGPADEIKNELRDAFRAAGIIFYDSWQASRWQAQKRIAKRIDDTVIGKWLIDMQLKKYFAEAYEPHEFNEIESAIYKVWAHVSRRFVEYTRTHLYATSGSASRKRVLLAVELPTAIRKKRHTDINAVPFKNMAKIKGPARRARYAALTGIRLAMRDAAKEIAAKSPDAEKAIIIYHTELMSYKLLRRNRLRRAKRKIPAVYRPSVEGYIFRMQQDIARRVAVSP